MWLTEWWNKEWIQLNLLNIRIQLNTINPNQNNIEIANKILSFINNNPKLDLWLENIQSILQTINLIDDILWKWNDNEEKVTVHFLNNQVVADIWENKESIKMILTTVQRDKLFWKEQIPLDKALFIIKSVEKLKNSEK